MKEYTVVCRHARTVKGRGSECIEMLTLFTGERFPWPPRTAIGSIRRPGTPLYAAVCTRSVIWWSFRIFQEESCAGGIREGRGRRRAGRRRDRKNEKRKRNTENKKKDELEKQKGEVTKKCRLERKMNTKKKKKHEVGKLLRRQSSG